MFDTDITPSLPTFDNARNRRQKSRAAGLDPNYWYPVELDRDLAVGGVQEVVFWKESIVIFRGEDLVVRAVSNRCVHRQLKLSIGNVAGCRIQCAYHGWIYDGDGRLVDVPHDTFGRCVPKIKLKSYPVRVRYGLIWIFPGDPEMATVRNIPDIAELEGPDRWACIPFAMTWNAHHSMIIDNVSDLTHAHLHRKYKPFDSAKLTGLQEDDDKVLLSYETRIGRGRISSLFVDNKNIDTEHIQLCFEYPYQWSNTDDQIKNWLSVLPIDENTTRIFFLFYFKSLKVPFLPVRIPRWAMEVVLRISNRVLIEPLFDQDRVAVEAEQKGYEAHWDGSPLELNPAVPAFQKLIIGKWEEHLARESKPNRLEEASI